MSFTEGFKDNVAIIMAIVLIIVPLAHMLIYPGTEIPETLITWATFAIQFLFGIGSLVYGTRILRKTLNSPPPKEEDDE
jgi:hypothetical protein